MQRSNLWILIGSGLGFLAVLMGAFGAHAVRGKIGDDLLAVYQTAAQYQMYHALALVGLGLWAGQHPTAATSVSGWAFTFGTLIFSGSLYALALSGVKVLGAITPIGGLLFMVGWIAFGVSAFKSPQ